MDIPFLDPAWHNFWYWFDHLNNADKIAYWSFLGGLLATPLIGLIAALTGARYGASAAYKLGRVQQRQDAEDKLHSSLTTAQFILIAQLNTLSDIKRRYLDPHRNEKDRFAHMGIIAISPTKQLLPFTEIGSFLVESGNPNLFGELHHAEILYLGTLTVVDDLRNEHLAFIKANAAKPKTIDPVSGRAVFATNEMDAYMLIRTTDNLYKIVDDSIPEFLRLVSGLTKLIKSSFPERKVLTIGQEKPPLTSNTPSQTNTNAA